STTVQRLVRIDRGIQPARVENDHREPKPLSARSTSWAIDAPLERNSGTRGAGVSASRVIRAMASRSSAASLHLRARASRASAILSSRGRYTVVFVITLRYHTY